MVSYQMTTLEIRSRLVRRVRQNRVDCVGTL
jgi:hypothetical protein